MSATLARHSGARCPQCKNLIERGDLIVVVDDQWLHEECEPHLGTWADTMPPNVETLARIVTSRPSLGRQLIAYDFSPEDISSLPPAIGDALVLALITENELRSLLVDVAAEHGES